MKVLVLRTCDGAMRSYRGFRWPDEGPVEAPDWDGGKRCCGGKLHGLLWGEGDAYLLGGGPGGHWLVVEVETDDGFVDMGDKCGFRRGVVVHKGDRITAPRHIYEHGGEGRRIAYLDARVGDGGALAGGDWSRLLGGAGSTVAGGRWSMVTGGPCSTVTGERGSTVTGGKRSTVTGGDESTVTGGDGSTVTGGFNSVVMGGPRSALSGETGGVLIWRGGEGGPYRDNVARAVSRKGPCFPNVKYRLPGTWGEGAGASWPSDVCFVEGV